MINRICISINNRCNLACKYCHFHEKEEYIEKTNMNVFKILDNVNDYIKRYELKTFKIGFVGNGEPFLDFDKLKKYIEYISNELKSGIITAYTITNGTLVSEEMLLFLKEHNVTVGFSIDGIRSIHNKWRCNSYKKVRSAIDLYKDIYGMYPTLNCTVGTDVLDNAEQTIEFFKQFDSRITFSRMIGKYGISMLDFSNFINKAKEKLNIRTGGYDCTMYGGLCGAGINNYFYANEKVYICGNCIDLGESFPYTTPIDEIKFEVNNFERNRCYKENLNK